MTLSKRNVYVAALFSLYFSFFEQQNGSTELGFGEFFLFVVVIKQIEAKCVNEPDYARRTFANLSNKFVSGEEEAKTEPVRDWYSVLNGNWNRY